MLIHFNANDLRKQADASTKRFEQGSPPRRQPNFSALFHHCSNEETSGGNSIYIYPVFLICIASCAQEARFPFWMGSFSPLRMTLTASHIHQRVSSLDWSSLFFAVSEKHILYYVPLFEFRCYHIFRQNPPCGERRSLSCSLTEMWSDFYWESKYAWGRHWGHRK